MHAGRLELGVILTESSSKIYTRIKHGLVAGWELRINGVKPGNQFERLRQLTTWQFL